MPAARIRDALAIYLLENHIDYLDDEMTTDRNYNQLANSVIRKFCSKEVGWLEEDTDDATYEKHIMMTEQGVFLAEFLQKMMKPEWEEFSSYIFNIYNILQNPDQWEPDIYVNALRSVYRNAKQLSGCAQAPGDLYQKNHRADGARGKPGKSDRRTFSNTVRAILSASTRV